MQKSPITIYQTNALSMYSLRHYHSPTVALDVTHVYLMSRVSPVQSALDQPCSHLEMAQALSVQRLQTTLGAAAERKLPEKS